MNEQLQISKDEWGPSEAKSNFLYINSVEGKFNPNLNVLLILKKGT